MVFLVLRQATLQNWSMVIKRCSSSALYVTGDKASNTYSVLTPHLNVEERLQDVEKLQKNVDLRGMKVNVSSFKNLWNLLKLYQEDKMQLEKRRIDVANQMKEAKLKGEPRAEKYRIEGRLIRDDLQTLMRVLWDLEGDTMIRFLALPNDLHLGTPESEPKLIIEYQAKPNLKTSNSHLSMGTSMNLVTYHSPQNYYLIGDSAIFELDALSYFSAKFQENFIQLSNTDFGRSVVIEGVGMKHKDFSASVLLKNEDTVVNDDNRLHLVGGASLVSFCALHSKLLVNSDKLPLRYFSIGRKYSPKLNLPSDGLFTTWQASALEIFVATSTHDEMMVEFEKTLDIIIASYKQLGLHFRVAYLPAIELNQWESLRASIQMYSTFNQTYLEVGNLSLCDDYISKRLLMTTDHDIDKNKRSFMHLVSGTIVSVPKLLAFVLEQSKENCFIVPEAIRLISVKQ